MQKECLQLLGCTCDKHVFVMEMGTWYSYSIIRILLIHSQKRIEGIQICSRKGIHLCKICSKLLVNTSRLLTLRASVGFIHFPCVVMVDEDALGYIKSGWFNLVLVWMGCRMYVVHTLATIIMVVWTNLKIAKLTAEICFPIILPKVSNWYC